MYLLVALLTYLVHFLVPEEKGLEISKCDLSTRVDYCEGDFHPFYQKKFMANDKIYAMII